MASRTDRFKEVIAEVEDLPSPYKERLAELRLLELEQRVAKLEEQIALAPRSVDILPIYGLDDTQRYRHIPVSGVDSNVHYGASVTISRDSLNNEEWDALYRDMAAAGLVETIDEE